MTDNQRLFMVELPLAAPVIMAGIRTAAVWTIGTATLSTPVRTPRHAAAPGSKWAILLSSP